MEVRSVKNYHGQPVCNGFAMGEAILYRHKVNKPVRVQIRDAEAELERLNKAKLMAGDQLECLRQKAQASCEARESPLLKT